MIRLVLRVIGRTLAWVAALVGAVWAFGALHYDFPFARVAVSWAFAALLLAGLVFVRGRWRKPAVVFGGFVLVLAWWLTLQPRHDREWQADVAELGRAEIHGDEVTLYNIRNCEYRSEFDYTPKWETRTVRLSQLTGVDVAIDYWGSPWIAHPIVSFQFADAPPLAFSIETRKEKGEAYSAIGGLYRQFELIYIAADERDVMRLRTNYRTGEDLYLYRTTLSAGQARERFLEYAQAMNALRDRPRWYNAATTNCTTAVRTQHAVTNRMPWDWRILANGKMDELFYEHGVIASASLPFAELRPRALINAAAVAADQSPDFSKLIREGRPGFGREGSNRTFP